MFAIDSGSFWLNRYYLTQLTFIDAYNQVAASNYLQSLKDLEMQASFINESFSEQEKAKNRKKDKYYKNYFNNKSSWIKDAKDSYDKHGIDVIGIATGYGFKYDKITGKTKTRLEINLPDKSNKFNRKNAARFRSFVEPSDTIYISDDFLDEDEILNFKSFKNKRKLLKKGARTNSQLLYNEINGRLFFNENGRKGSWRGWTCSNFHKTPRTRSIKLRGFSFRRYQHLTQAHHLI